MKKTKLITTIGPSSNDKQILREFFKFGANICRLNFSHSDHSYHQSILDNINEVRQEGYESIAVLLDTKGPEIRTGKLENGKKVLLKKNNQLIVCTN